MSQNPGTKNEGEGSRTAAKQYSDTTEKFAKSGKVEPAANAAKKSYLDYQNLRKDHVEAVVGKLLNWDFASAGFAKIA